MGSISLLIFALGASLYFLPAIIGRHKRNHTSILLLNLFLGWTVVGWVIALVWAVSQDIPVSSGPISAAPAGPFCPACGRGLEPRDVFCRNCGNKARTPAA